MNFGEALIHLESGSKLQRVGWNGNGMYVKAQIPDENSKMTHPYLYMTIPGCEEGERRLPWQPAQVDLFAKDWRLVD